eukprot:jgi/Bigna1/86035/estExt_fgenesh1_pg.C_70307
MADSKKGGGGEALPGKGITVDRTVLQRFVNTDTGESLAIPGRHLIKEAKVMKQGKINKTERTLVLFNDVICVCKTSKSNKDMLLPKEIYPLDKIFLDEDVSKGLIRMRNAIKIKKKDDKDYVVLGFPDEDTREMWITLVKATAQSHLKKNMKGVQKYASSTDLHKGNLHWCIHNGKTSEVKRLIEGKANVNLKNLDGNCALHLAVHPSSNPDVDIVDLLLENGAQPHFKDSEGQTTFHIAINHGLHGILQLLCNAARPAVDMPNRDGVVIKRRPFSASNLYTKKKWRRNTRNEPRF